MNIRTVQYFRDTHSEPIAVRLEIKESELVLIEPESNQRKQYSFSKCNYSQQDGDAIITLNLLGEYLLVPTSSVYYFPLISKINTRRTFQSFAKPKLLLILSSLLFLLVLSYLFFAKAVPLMAVKFVSIKQETKIGNQYYASFIRNVDVDSLKTAELQKFTDNLNLSNKYHIRVTVVNDTIVNAFAFPGGHIVVYSGIINKMNKPEELVALLSHEATHVNKRHSLKSIVSQLGVSVLLSIITTNTGGLSKAVLNNVDMLRILSYSRELEKEADEEGMKLMVKNDINPNGMRWLMEDLKKTNTDIPFGISFLSTHPMTDERIKNAIEFCKKYTQYDHPISDSEFVLWNSIKKESAIKKEED